MALKAVIWDVDGTLAETERDGHRVAFNRAFARRGLPWQWDAARYGELLAVAGGEERLRVDLADRPDVPPSAIDALARDLHRLKNACYAELVASRTIALRPGVRRLIDACTADGLRQAIATTTSRANVDLLLSGTFGPDWASRFAAVLCAEQAPVKKPDPSVYALTLASLGIAADEAVALEDSPNGVAAASAAGIAVLVTRSEYFRDAHYDATVARCDDLDSTVSWNDRQWPSVDVDVLRRIVADRHARA